MRFQKGNIGGGGKAYSVEDDGAGICFNVFIYNSQPGIKIDYATGESYLIEKDISKM